MPKDIPFDFSLLTLLTHSPHSPKVIRNVRLSTPGVRQRTVTSGFCNLTTQFGFDEFVV
jgi:hypothetical protein